MLHNKYRILKKLSVSGVVERDQVKNDLDAVRSLIQCGYVKKVYRSGRVFYELCEKALPLLDAQREILKQLARLKSHLYPRRFEFYQALLGDVRFLDVNNKEAREFQFLGDWRLNQKPVKSQLLLSQFRFYRDSGLI